MVIRRETIAAALPATANDERRYTLQAVHIEPATGDRAARVVSTNGNVLIIAEESNPIPDADFPIIAGAPFHSTPATPVLVSADIAKRVIKTTPKRVTVPALGCVQISTNGSENVITVAATDLGVPTVATVHRDDVGTFPRYERVIPNDDTRETVPVCLAVDVLETLIKAAKAAEHKYITFAIPSDAQGRDRIRDANGDKTDKLGEVTSAINFKMSGGNADVSVRGCAMPMSRD